MTVQELEQVIQGLFRDIYNKIYTGKLNIQKLDPVGYCVEFGMDRPDQPTVIYAELDDDKFIKFLREQIKSMRINLTHYGKLFLAYPYDCNPINTSCYDKGRDDRENR